MLMVVFAAGVIGCAITIPVCAIKFFAILFERGEQQVALVPAYRGEEPARAEPETTRPSPPRARAAAAGASQK